MALRLPLARICIRGIQGGPGNCFEKAGLFFSSWEEETWSSLCLRLKAGVDSMQAGRHFIHPLWVHPTVLDLPSMKGFVVPPPRAAMRTESFPCALMAEIQNWGCVVIYQIASGVRWEFSLRNEEHLLSDPSQKQREVWNKKKSWFWASAVVSLSHDLGENRLFFFFNFFFFFPLRIVDSDPGSGGKN